MLQPNENLDDEALEWALMTPQERWRQSQWLWVHYVQMGGSLDPDPDPQSPFYDPEAPGAVPADGRSGLHLIRRSGI